MGPNLTPITEATFKKWKQDRKAKQAEEEAKLAKEKQEAFKKFRAGVKSGMAFSGKELFDFNPELAKAADGEDEDGAMDVYEREDSDHEGESHEPVAVYLGEDGGRDDDVLAEKLKSTVFVTEELYDELEGLDDDDDDDDDDGGN